MGLIQMGNFQFQWGRSLKLRYPNTPELFPQVLMSEGKPELIEVTNENAFQMFINTAEVYSVINRRGYMLASGVWKHYKTIGDKVEEIKNSDVVQLLENPNPLCNGNDFLRMWNENELVHGNNYMYKLTSQSIFPEIPATLTNLIATQIRINTTGKWWDQRRIEDIIQSYEYLYGGINTDKHIFNTRDIIHTKNVGSMNPIKGDSPLIPLNMEINNIRSAKKFRNTINSNNGALGILSSQTGGNGAIPLTPVERARIEKEYREHYGIKDSQSKILMSQSGSLKWEPMSYPTKDLMLFESVSADFRSVIDRFGMNDMIFSREKGATFTNLAEGLKHAYQVTVIPDADEKAMRLSKEFGLVEKGEFLCLDYDHLPILQKNEKEKAEILDRKANAVQKLKTSGVYSDDEIRGIAGFDIQE